MPDGDFYTAHVFGPCVTNSAVYAANQIDLRNCSRGEPPPGYLHAQETTAPHEPVTAGDTVSQVVDVVT